jgi:hypothetical protein
MGDSAAGRGNPHADAVVLRQPSRQRLKIDGSGLRRRPVEVKGARQVMRVTGKMRCKVGAALGVDGEFKPGLASPASFLRRRV